jgi:serine protease Do
MRRNDSGPSRWTPSWVPPKLAAGFRRWNMVIIAVIAFVVLGAFVATAVPGLERRASAAPKVSLKIDKDPAPVSLADFKNGYSPVIGPALPAVVNISSTKVVKQENNIPSELFNNPMFRQFFGDPSDGGEQQPTPRSQREHSLGSGVIVNPDGYILTNDHVISGASDIEVFTQDKKKFKATLVGTDSMTDIAVLKINATGLPSLTLGDSSNLKVGDMVFAIGDPFGIGETATMGIVSATGRGLGGAIEHYENFIQTDAAINPGNSGGALLDLHGDLIGINTAILSNGGGGGNQGVGFAIPINMAHNVMEQIVEHGKVVRGHLGIAIQGVDADMAKAFGLNQGGGALVSDVTPESPAAKAGIERGDIILALNGQPINGPEDLSVNVSQIAPGSTIHLKVARNGQTRDVQATLGEMAEKEGEHAGKEAATSALKGIQVDNLTPRIARELGVAPETTGVVVTSVDSSSEAAQAGLQRGDVIQEVNRKPVHDVKEYEQAIASGNNQTVLLLANRGGTTHFLVVSPQ